nr:MAG TPA: hypothetical protein [Caudoviricetes sp.]
MSFLHHKCIHLKDQINQCIVVNQLYHFLKRI